MDAPGDRPELTDEQLRQALDVLGAADVGFMLQDDHYGLCAKIEVDSAIPYRVMGERDGSKRAIECLVRRIHKLSKELSFIQ